MRALPITLLLVGALAAGCGDYSNRPLSEDLAFLQAVPARAALELRVAADTPRELELVEGADGLAAVEQAELGEPATFLALARAICIQVNRGVFGLLAQIEWIVRHVPPTVREADRRVWGPWPAEQPGVDVRFLMARTGEHYFGFRLQLRPAALRGERAFDEGWSDCLYGGLEPEAGSLRRGRGNLTLDLAACADVTGSGERGLASVGFDTRPDAADRGGKTDLQILFVDFLPADELAKGADARPLDALYTYLEHDDRAGAFGFLAWTDVDEADPQRNARERVMLEARWNAAGAGQANAQVTQGDLGEAVIDLLECWDEEQLRVHYHDSLDLRPAEGDPAACRALPAD